MPLGGPYLTQILSFDGVSTLKALANAPVATRSNSTNTNTNTKASKVGLKKGAVHRRGPTRH
jgi:hypothetical protein